ncbi:Glycosyltransferase involved in cell wall bisynthesis [Pseudidiomarina maritima]|uniref:Glycosyltransferase involved in cell wall bisynthesis n=1 Tax=Pseudidiomarina maritima TaxID=519453 RepID=A0A1I6GS86_9GAMM|nr:glycosyltransferase [Pseudidiomarina maritima]SFR44996.1 Glycosyltransferase involved in cell wall bisynthesis [Pseudidiomarina maritima]
MISVIVPVYNVEKYIDDCLESLAQQSNQNFELIIVNDGSQDQSMAKAQQWIAQMTNVMVINQPNGGLSAARNTGLEKATGEYVLFLDSDDMLSTNAIEVLSSIIEDSIADVILYSAGIFEDGVDSTRLKFNMDAYSRHANDYPENLRGVDYLDRVLATNRFIVSACLYAFKRELAVSLRFINGIIHEDNHFTPALLLLADKIKLLDNQLYKRRVREGSITTTSISSRNIEGYFYSAKGLEKDIQARLNEDSYSVYLSVLKRLYQATLATALKTKKISVIRHWCHIIELELNNRKDIQLSRKYDLLMSYPFLVTCIWLCIEKMKKLGLK